MSEFIGTDCVIVRKDQIRSIQKVDSKRIEITYLDNEYTIIEFEDEGKTSEVFFQMCEKLYCE